MHYVKASKQVVENHPCICHAVVLPIESTINTSEYLTLHGEWKGGEGRGGGRGGGGEDVISISFCMKQLL